MYLPSSMASAAGTAAATQDIHTHSIKKTLNLNICSHSINTIFNTRHISDLMHSTFNLHLISFYYNNTFYIVAFCCKRIILIVNARQV